MTAPVERLPLIVAIEERLALLPDTNPVTKGYLSEATKVPSIDDVGHVQRYWVLHPFNGVPDLEQDLAEAGGSLDWAFQLTVAAGFARDVHAIAEDAEALLYQWAPDLEGYVCGRLKPPPGYDPGPVRPDKDENPHRFWLPLQYRTTITRASA